MDVAQGGSAPIDQSMLSRIYRYVQTHSHSDAIGDADEDLTMLAESRAVLVDLFALFRNADPDHCDRMIRRVAPEAE